MGADAEFEYAVMLIARINAWFTVNVRLDEEHGPRKPLDAANGMAAEGWTLVSCTRPQLDWTVMVFSRPRRPDAMSPVPSRSLGAKVTDEDL